MRHCRVLAVFIVTSHYARTRTKRNVVNELRYNNRGLSVGLQLAAKPSGAAAVGAGQRKAYYQPTVRHHNRNF